jgi:hypothetical protein
MHISQMPKQRTCPFSLKYLEASPIAAANGKTDEASFVSAPCTRHGCALFLPQVDPKGNIVEGVCAILTIAISLDATMKLQIRALTGSHEEEAVTPS